jgi:hypothetical protein
MIRRIALALCPLALGCMLAATSASARGGIGLPGFVGSVRGSGIGLPGFPGSGPGFPGTPSSGAPALPPGPPSSPGLATPVPSVVTPTPDVANPYFYQPPPSDLSSVDKQRVTIYHDQLSAQDRELQQRRMSGAVTAQQQRDLWQAENELNRVDDLLGYCSPAVSSSCGATPPAAPVKPLQVPLPDVGSRPTIMPN